MIRHDFTLKNRAFTATGSTESVDPLSKIAPPVTTKDSRSTSQSSTKQLGTGTHTSIEHFEIPIHVVITHTETSDLPLEKYNKEYVNKANNSRDRSNRNRVTQPTCTLHHSVLRTNRAYFTFSCFLWSDWSTPPSVRIPENSMEELMEDEVNGKVN